MNQKNIIIILLLIIVILALAIGIVFLQTNGKEPTKIKITSNKTLYEGDSLTVKLADFNKTPLSKQKVNIVVTDKNGKVVVNETVKTNSKGKANVDLDLEKGKYNVNATYGGNENYTGNATKQKLTIEEVTTTTVTATQSSSLPYSIDNLPPSNDPNPETRRYQVDEYTVIQEYSDNYRSVVDLRTGSRHGGFF